MKSPKSLILCPPLPVISYDCGNKESFGFQLPTSLTWRKARPEDPEDIQQE